MGPGEFIRQAGLVGPDEEVEADGWMSSAAGKYTG